ncbi:MAG TPA: hypothetical protein VFQ65_17950 [Kofleriaceae bacterium]|nr:hypothetical protein [Kofleriaceae bacterium]
MDSNDPPMLGMHLTRDEAAAQAAQVNTDPTNVVARRSANMSYHGGKIMPTAVSKIIFWGPSWANSSFAGDKISGLDSWYSGHSNSNYAKTVDEYTGTNGTVGATTTHQGHIVDTSTAANGSSTSAILAEVCKQITAGNIVPDAGGNGYYAVYTDVKRGNAGYCAYHSAGSCGGKAVQFAFFFNLDGDAGCDPSDSTTGHSQGLAALANVTAHELSEARSDPASPGAWYDSSGAENGDKCAWAFNVASVSFPNGTKWKMQGEWSNKAYTAGTGYANLSGQHGCLDGH